MIQFSGVTYASVFKMRIVAALVNMFHVFSPPIFPLVLMAEILN